MREKWELLEAGFNREARIVNDRGGDVVQEEVGELIVKGKGYEEILREH